MHGVWAGVAEWVVAARGGDGHHRPPRAVVAMPRLVIGLAIGSMMRTGLVVLSLLALATETGAGVPGPEHLGARGRINFGDAGAIAMYGAQRGRSVFGELPVVSVDPSAAHRGTVAASVPMPSTSTHVSHLTYRFPTNETVSELHFGVRVYIDHAASQDGLDALQFLRMITFTGTSVVTATNDTDGTSVRIGTETTGSVLSTPVAPRTSTRIRVHFRAAQPGSADGLLRVWVDDVLALDRNDHDLVASIRTIMLRCQSSPPLSTHADGTTVHFSEVSWGPHEDDARWTDQGLQFGAVHSMSDLTKVDVRLRYGLEVGVHDPVPGGGLSVQYQYRMSLGPGNTSGEPPMAWMNAGGPATVLLDGGEFVDHRTIEALEPCVAYEFRAVVQDSTTGGNVIDLVSNTCAMTLPSASEGTPAAFDFAFGACASAAITPLITFDTIRARGPSYFFALGDIAYADSLINEFLVKARTESDFQSRFRAQVTGNLEQHACYASMSPAFMRDNHDRAGVRYGAGALAVTSPPNIGVNSNTVAHRYLTDRRLRTLPASVAAGSPGEGSDGAWFTTAQCLFILADGLFARNGDPGDRTFWGATQREEIKTLLRTNTKPLVFLLNGVPVGDVTDASPLGIVAEFPEWIAERDELVQAFVDHNACSTQLFILTGDRHKVLVWDWHDDVRIRPEWSVSPLAQRALAPNGSSVADPHYQGWGPYALNQTNTYLYGLVEVDEETLDVTISARDGVDDAVVHQETYSPPQVSCPTDLDQDCRTGFSDVLVVIGAWGPCGVCVEDVDGSGDVGFGDVLALIGGWGSCVR